MMTARIARKTVICIFWSMSLITSIILFNMSKSNGKLFMLISFLGFGNTFISFAATCCAMCCCDEEQMYHGFLLFCSLFVIISQATILNVYIIAFFRGFRHQVMLMSKHMYNCTSRTLAILINIIIIYFLNRHSRTLYSLEIFLSFVYLLYHSYPRIGIIT